MFALRRVVPRRASRVHVQRLRTASVQQRRLLPRVPQRARASAAADDTAAQEHAFEADTAKLLQLVTHSLYLDNAIFLRELLSNASDALEKRRHAEAAAGDAAADPLRIELQCDDERHELRVCDSGVGMTRAELAANLGRIGRSGSLEFRESLASAAAAGDRGAASSIIGQFGVGFYAAFMVAARVTVLSRSRREPALAHRWSSTGSGSYELRELSGAEADAVPLGTQVCVELKPEHAKFAKRATVEQIVKKYSNFVGFDIMIESDVINTVKPLWLEPNRNVSDDENREFYQFIAHAFDEPRFTFRYQTDSPLNIRALFYVGQQHSEKFGMSRMETGVSLYSRKVLIQQKADGLLPEWLRFVKGVVDSEDVPLNVGREHLQESALVARLNNILTKRLLRFFADEAKRRAEQYNEFFQEFGHFFKEGVCSDHQWRGDIARLLRMESSAAGAGQVCSFDEYVSRMRDKQKAIYYLVAPSRELALASPYYEGYESKNVEVLFLYSALDEFVMSNLAEYQGTPLRSIEAGDDLEELGDKSATSDKSDDDAADKSDDAADKKSAESDASAQSAAAPALSESDAKALCSWLRSAMPDKLSSVKTTARLTSTPAIVTDHQSATFRRMMRTMDPDNVHALPPQQLEINPKHGVIRRLALLRDTDDALAREVAAQLVDNALIAAGLLDDARAMLPRLTRLLELSMAAKTDRTDGASDKKE